MIYESDLIFNRRTKKISFECPCCEEKTTMDRKEFVERFGSPRILARCGESVTCQCCKEDLCVGLFVEED